ncbi:MAG: BirA family transcriptional regulator, partial [Pseudonocardiales bacterium]|nr:BirA family transcriptional regulator [Pseudonocardiales bacterium]
MDLPPLADPLDAPFETPLADPLDVVALRSELLAPAGPVARLDVVSRTGSTNADLLASARAGSPDRAVRSAELQKAGRGRLDR